MLGWQHVNAIDRAGGHAQIAARALGDDHCVHLFGGAENGIHRAGLNAFGAADAFGLANESDPALPVRAMGNIQRDNILVQQRSKFANGGIATRGAFVDGVAIADGFSVGFASRIVALAALGLRQQGIDTFAESSVEQNHGAILACLQRTRHERHGLVRLFAIRQSAGFFFTSARMWKRALPASLVIAHCLQAKLPHRDFGVYLGVSSEYSTDSQKIIEPVQIIFR